MTTSIFTNVPVDSFLTTGKKHCGVAGSHRASDIYEAPATSLESQIVTSADELLMLGDAINIRQSFAALESTVELTPNDSAFLAALNEVALEGISLSASKPKNVNVPTVVEVRDNSTIERLVLKAWKFLTSLLGKIKRLISGAIRSTLSRVGSLEGLIKKVKESDRDDYRFDASHLFAFGEAKLETGVLEVDENTCHSMVSNLEESVLKSHEMDDVANGVLSAFSGVDSGTPVTGMVDNLKQVLKNEVYRVTGKDHDDYASWFMGVCVKWSVSMERPFTTIPMKPLTNPSKLQLSKVEMIQVLNGLVTLHSALALPQKERSLNELIKVTNTYRTKEGAYSSKFHGAMVSFSREFYVRYVNQLLSNLNQYIRVIEASID